MKAVLQYDGRSSTKVHAVSEPKVLKYSRKYPQVEALVWSWSVVAFEKSSHDGR